MQDSLFRNDQKVGVNYTRLPDHENIAIEAILDFVNNTGRYTSMLSQVNSNRWLSPGFLMNK